MSTSLKKNKQTKKEMNMLTQNIKEKKDDKKKRKKKRMISKKQKLKNDEHTGHTAKRRTKKKLA